MVAQQMKVTGVVINEDDGEPVIGASIVVKGTTIGTITDLDGKFEASAGTILRSVSFTISQSFLWLSPSSSTILVDCELNAEGT